MACRLVGAKPLSEPMLGYYWTLRKKLQWNIDRNPNSFIQENAFENVVCEIAAIFPRPQWVNPVFWDFFYCYEIVKPRLIYIVNE